MMGRPLARARSALQKPISIMCSAAHCLRSACAQHTACDLTISYEVTSTAKVLCLHCRGLRSHGTHMMKQCVLFFMLREKKPLKNEKLTKPGSIIHLTNAHAYGERFAASVSPRLIIPNTKIPQEQPMGKPMIS